MDGLSAVFANNFVPGVLIPFPVLEAIGWAFTDFNVLKEVTVYIGWDNFKAMNQTRPFLTALSNSVLLTTIVIVLQYALGLGLAVTLKQQVPGIGFFRSVVMASWVIPVISTVIMFRFMSQPDYGFFNIFLKNRIGTLRNLLVGSLAAGVSDDYSHAPLA